MSKTKLTILLAAIAVAGAVVVALINLIPSGSKDSPTGQTPITTHGNNSPVVNQSGTGNQSVIAGNSSTVNQIAGGATFNQTTTINPPDTRVPALLSNLPAAVAAEIEEKIVKRMDALLNKNKSYLEGKYPFGHILFTATYREQIVPLGSPMDKLLNFDWASKPHAISFEDESIVLALPDFAFTNSGAVTRHYGSKIYLPRAIGAQGAGMTLNDQRVAFEVMDTNEYGVIIAMGMQKAPVRPRPQRTTP